jgi:hypothetical protein
LQSLSEASSNGESDSNVSVTLLCETESLLSLLTQADPTSFSLGNELGVSFLSGLESSFVSLDERYLNEPFVQLLFGLINTVIGDWTPSAKEVPAADLLRHSNRAESAIWPWLSKFDDSLLILLKHSVNSICSSLQHAIPEAKNDSSKVVGSDSSTANSPQDINPISLQDAFLLTLWILRLYQKVPRAVKSRRMQPILETILKQVTIHPLVKKDVISSEEVGNSIQGQWEALSMTVLGLHLQMTLDVHSSKGSMENGVSKGILTFCPPEVWQRAVEAVLKNSVDALNIQTCLALILRSSVNVNSDWHRTLFVGPSAAGSYFLDRSRWEKLVSGDPEHMATIDYMIRKLGIESGRNGSSR